MASITNAQTHVRVNLTAPKLISSLAKKLAATRGGSWKTPAVVDEALKTLKEVEDAKAAKAKAS